MLHSLCMETTRREDMSANERGIVVGEGRGAYVCDVLPVLVSDDVPVGLDVGVVAASAVEAAFRVVHGAFEAAGSARFGDVAPDEAYVLDAVGRAFVGMVALNGERS